MQQILTANKPIAQFRDRAAKPLTGFRIASVMDMRDGRFVTDKYITNSDNRARAIVDVAASPAHNRRATTAGLVAHLFFAFA